MRRRPLTLARSLLAATLLALLVVAVVLAPPLPAALARGRCLIPPVQARISEPFVMPACRYCPGHRGVEFATTPGSPVVAAADGSVTFSGTVAGERYLVLRHPDGVRATYGGLASVVAGLTAGTTVRAGSVVGAAGDGVYFGLRADDPEETPIDPTPLLGRWRFRPRLLPTDGSRSRLPPAPRLVCLNGSEPR